MKQYFYALATFTGTIIGVGIFGLPYATAQIGFIPILFYFAFLGLITILIHLIFGEICLRTPGAHRLPGLAEIYLGKRIKWISVFSNTIGLLGANLAYLIVGGSFLASFFAPIFAGPELAYILIFYFSGALIIYLGTKTISESEFFSLIIFFIILFFLFAKGSFNINLANLATIDLKNLILPYGVILFSLAGMSVIPEIKEILGQKNRFLKNIIITGTIIPIFTYLIFIILVLGVNGAQTSPDALNGLVNALGQNIVGYGFLFGVITTFTSYLTIGITIKKIFWYDLNFSHFSAWIIACFTPLLLYLIGFNDFIKIIAFIGAVTIGIDGITVFLIHQKAKKQGKVKPIYEIKLAKPIIYLIMAIFLAGVVVEIVNLQI
ncbi:MAG TPA: aromatic amino acid transport family protein [Patescibacteria group bacterium]|nr:aromatic amino acid transport family protein [Patescibacteria group bacterium]